MIRTSCDTSVYLTLLINWCTMLLRLLLAWCYVSVALGAKYYTEFVLKDATEAPPVSEILQAVHAVVAVEYNVSHVQTSQLQN